MGAAFDGELYLRLAAERAVLDPMQAVMTPWSTPLMDIASALVAVDAVPAEIAQQIVDDTDLALLVRGRGGRQPPPRPLSPGRPRGQAMGAPRIVTCNEEFHRPWGRLRVHYVTLGDRATAVAISAMESTPGALMQTMTLPAQVPLTDDRGTSEIATFSGGGGGVGFGYHGRLVTMHPLSRTTRWIDLPDAHIELSDRMATAPVRVEPLPPAIPAARYLWKRVAGFRFGPYAGALDEAIRALVAAGALASDDAVIDDVRAVAHASVQHGGYMPAMRGVPMPLSVAGPPTATLPEPWRSLLGRQGQGGGRHGAVGIGVVTPPIDGVTIAVEGLVSHEHGFDVHVTTSPGVFFGAIPFAHSVTDEQPTWWAVDDCGNHYLAGSGGWGGSGVQTEGTVSYQPALDPSASVLHLLPTLQTERGVIDVTLPDWNGVR